MQNACECESSYTTKDYNQSTDSTGGSLSHSVGWENGPERGLKTIYFNP